MERNCSKYVGAFFPTHDRENKRKGAGGGEEEKDKAKTSLANLNTVLLV